MQYTVQCSVHCTVPLIVDILVVESEEYQGRQEEITGELLQVHTYCTLYNVHTDRNQYSLYERTKFFVNDGVAEEKNLTIDSFLGSFRETKKNDRFS